MKIRETRFHFLRHPLAPLYGDAAGLKRERTTVVVKVTTEDGLIGWGEFFRSRVTQDMLRKIAELLAGADPIASAPLVDRMSLVSPMVAAGVEIALWDIRGKASGLGIVQLLGGPYRTAQPAYASHQNVSEAQDVTGTAVAEALASSGRGFRAVKMKVGWHSPAVDGQWIARVLDALPDDVALAIDANRALDLAKARFILRLLDRPHRIAWFEEPLGKLWPEAYRELRMGVEIPIAGGESMDMAMLERVVATRSMDIINPDLVGHGGFARMQHLFALCDAYGVRLIPHVFDGEIGRLATLHLLAARPDWTERQGLFRAAPLECDISPNPLRDELLEVPLAPNSEGSVPVPTGPGLGIGVREDVLKTYAEALPV